MSSTTTITCPECGTVLRPAKPLSAGKSVKCPKCQAGFVVGDNEPRPAASKSKGPSPVQKKPPVAPIVPTDDDEDGGGGTYDVKGELGADGPAIDYAPDMSIRDLRGPAMVEIVDPSNKLIIVGVTGFVGWVAFLVTLLIPVLFPLQTRQEREKARAELLKQEEMKRAATKPGMVAPPPQKVEEETSFLSIGGLDLRDIGDLPWYLVVPCLLPMIFGMIYSGALSMGAVKIQNLESRDWGVASSIMAMVPLNAGGLLCMLALVLNITLDFLFEGSFKWIVLSFFLICAWGVNLAAGIWMLTVLNKPDVIAGFEYVAE
jgi:hypothetical protein